MISSVYLHSDNYLYSISGSNQLNVHDVSDFINLSYGEIPKIESQLGVSLRGAISTFTLPNTSSEFKFVNGEENTTFPNKFLFVFDNKTILSVNLLKLQENKQEKTNILYGQECEGYLQQEEEISTAFLIKNDLENTNAIEEEQEEIDSNEKNKPVIIIATNTGRILEFSVENNTKTNEVKLKLKKEVELQSLQKSTNKSGQVEKPTNLTNNNSSSNSQLLANYGNSEQNIANNNKAKKDYVTAISVKDSIIYLATVNNRLLCLDIKNSLEFRSEYDTTSLKELIENQSNPSKDLSIEAGFNEHFSGPLKIILVGNSLLLLTSKFIFEFNTHTHTLTNSITLPFNTLNFAAQHHPKTQATTLLIVGECNAFYSMPYPWNLGKEKCVVFKKVNISSKFAKSLLQTNNNYLFVGGCDGTIDVYKNACMHLMVLLA